MKLIALLVLALPLVVLAEDKLTNINPNQIVVKKGTLIPKGLSDKDLKAQEFYGAGEFNVTLYGGVTTPDFDAERLSVGAGAAYFFTKQLGAEIEGFAGDTDGVFVDQAAAQLIYRIPVGQSAPYLFAGAFYNFEDRVSTADTKTAASDEENWGVSVGLGIEHRFSRNFGVFTDARIEKYIESGDPQARARAGIRLAF